MGPKSDRTAVVSPELKVRLFNDLYRVNLKILVTF